MQAADHALRPRRARPALANAAHGRRQVTVEPHLARYVAVGVDRVLGRAGGFRCHRARALVVVRLLVQRDVAALQVDVRQRCRLVLSGLAQAGAGWLGQRPRGFAEANGLWWRRRWVHA